MTTPEDRSPCPSREAVVMSICHGHSLSGRPPPSYHPIPEQCIPLDGILTSPLARSGLVPRAVGLVNMCNLGDERVVGVGVSQHGADGEEDCVMLDRVQRLRRERLDSSRQERGLTFADSQSRAPLVSENV